MIAAVARSVAAALLLWLLATFGARAVLIAAVAVLAAAAVAVCWLIAERVAREGGWLVRLP